MIPLFYKLWLLLFCGALLPLDERYPHAVTVFTSSFEAESDADFDAWPDGWTRRRAVGFPHYVEASLTADTTAVDGKRHLHVKLDGGSVAISSPRVAISARSSYVAEAMARTNDLKQDVAFISLTFLDASFRELETHNSHDLKQSQPWTRLRVGPLAPQSREACFAVITLHLAAGKIADLHGTIDFDDVWLGRQPHLTLTTGQPRNIYQLGDPIELVCEASDLETTAGQVTFELLDPRDQVLAQKTRPLEFAEPAAAEATDQEHALRWGSATWQPPIKAGGYYRVRAFMRGTAGLLHENTAHLAVLAPLLEPNAGEFGWALNQGAGPVDREDLAELLTQMGVSRLKYPLWYDPNNPLEAKELSQLVDRLNARRIGVVGLLSPPPEVRATLKLSPSVTAAQTFSLAADAWFPTLEPALLGLSLKVRRWQVGLDDDLSLIQDPAIAEKLGEVRARLDQMGPGLELGLAWDWLQEPPALPHCQFLSMTTDPPLTAKELTGYLTSTSSSSAPQPSRWVNLLPLDRQQYDAEARVRDLAERMLAAKLAGADAIFMAAPISSEQGLLHDDGTPSELLLPWRTMATLLSGAKHLGSIPLPAESQNQVFLHNGQTIMMLWNERPTRERLLLGGGARQISIWGEVSPLPINDGEQTVTVGPMPTFVVGMSESIVRLRMGFQLASPRIASVIGEGQDNTLLFTNPLSRGLVGKLQLVAPEGWRIQPSSIPVKLAAGEQMQIPLRITLPYAATTGVQMLRLDAELTADERYALSLYRPIEVGMGDIVMELTSQVTDDGQLRVEQRMLNRGGKTASFRCQLQAPGRRPLRSQVLDLADSEDLKQYRFADGRSLVGQTLWLRAEEINGPRVLNYRVLAEE